jgi:cyanate lyase
MTAREALTEKIVEQKRAKGLKWKEIAAQLGQDSEILLTAALLGQMTLTPDQAKKAGELFGLTTTEQVLLTEPPYRGAGVATGPPTDPTIYRFYELLQVYGSTFKELIHEEFGDGIMSAIDFEMQMKRRPDPKGDRVEITMHGKFLPYRRY